MDIENRSPKGESLERSQSVRTPKPQLGRKSINGGWWGRGERRLLKNLEV